MGWAQTLGLMDSNSLLAMLIDITFFYKNMKIKTSKVHIKVKSKGNILVLALGGCLCPSREHEDNLVFLFLYIPGIKKNLGVKLGSGAFSGN